MKIKLSPQQSSSDSTVKLIDENSILVDGTVHEFDESEAFPDICEETDGAIIEAHRENGVLFATARRCYLADFKDWYTGEYEEIQPEQVEGEFPRVKHAGKSSAIILSEFVEALCDQADSLLFSKFLAAGYQYNGKTIQTDQIAITNANGFLTALTAGLPVLPIKWRTKENDYIEFATTGDFGTFAAGLLAFIQAEYQAEWDTKDAMRAAKTRGEAQEIFEGYMNK